jgi:Fic family protein
MTAKAHHKYELTHPWLKFSLDLRATNHIFWMMLGECQSKIEHLAGVPLRPGIAKELHRLYLAKGAQATTAIEGNTLTEDQVLAIMDKRLTLPPSHQYLEQEVTNIIDACNAIGKDVFDGNVRRCSFDRIREFNRMVLKGLKLEEGIVAGEVPTATIVVGRYRAAPREDCEYLVDRLCDWLNGADFAPRGEIKVGMAIIRAVIAHLYLAWIHPFGDGNGRTARLFEFEALLAAGVPAPAAHLLSNHYNLTRTEYYRQLDYASRSNGDTSQFLAYAVQGLRDGLQEQINRIREQQRDVAWRNYVHETFNATHSAQELRRRHLILDLAQQRKPVPRSELTLVSGRVAAQYRGKTARTLARDIQALEELKLLRSQPILDDEGRHVGVGFVANVSLIDAFLPNRAAPG